VSKHILKSWTLWLNALMIVMAWGFAGLGVLTYTVAWAVTAVAVVNMTIRLMTHKPIHIY